MTKPVLLNIKGRTLDELIDVLHEPIIIFAGAGVSIPAPTCAPSWWTLTQDILKNFFARAPDVDNLGELRFKIERQPEEVFENFSNILDQRLFTVFQVLNEGKPNAVHNIVAQLIKTRKIHAIITTNFDNYFEQALEIQNIPYRLVVTNRDYDQYLCDGCPEATILKIHGTTNKPETIVSVASQYKTSKGFSLPKADVFFSLLSHYQCLFLGYSGWDFEHSNYKRFWKSAAPKCKGIIWNVRPGELQGPPLNEIIPTQNLRFTEGELPNVLIDLGNKLGLDTISSKIYTKESADHEWQENSIRRESWIEKWVKKIPMSFIIGLTLTDLSTYSTTYQNWMKKGHQKTMEQAQIDQIMETQNRNTLLQKMQKGEITPQEFQIKSMALTVDSIFYNAPPDKRPKLKEIASKVIKEKYNGIAMMAMQYIQVLVQFARSSLSLDDVEKKTEELMNRKKFLEDANTKDSEFELKIIDWEPLIVDIKGTNLKKILDAIALVKEKYLTEKINSDDLHAEIKKIGDEIVRINSGQVDFNLYRDLLVQEVLICPEDQFVDSIDALALTILHQSQMLMWKVKNDPRTNPIKENGVITEQSLNAIENAIRAPYLKVFDRIRQFNSGDVLLAKLELALSAIWIKLTQYFGRPGLEKYQESLQNENYFVNGIPEECVKKITEKLAIVDSQETKLNPRYRQLIYSHKAILGEGSNNFNLVKTVVEASLKDTEGIVTEATQPPIPEVLAGFYDRNGDYPNAVKWYDIALEALRLAVPRKEGDMIVYRAMICNVQIGNKKRAIEIAGKYLSAYTELSIIRGPQYKKFGIDLTTKLSNELGYSSVEVAFKEILPQKIY